MLIVILIPATHFQIQDAFPTRWPLNQFSFLSYLVLSTRVENFSEQLVNNQPTLVNRAMLLSLYLQRPDPPHYFHCQILSQAFKVMNLWLVPWGFHKSFWQGHLDHYKTLSTILNVALSRSLNQCGSPIPEKALGLPTIELRFQLLLQKIKIHSFPLSKQERVTQMFRIKTDTFAPEEVSYTICHSPTSIFWDKHDRLIQNYGLALPLEVFPHSLC